MNPILFVVIISLVCLLGFFNEKVTKLTYEISLMLFSIMIGGILLLVVTLARGTDIADVLSQSQFINIERFLMEGVLCFMLFAGSCHMKLSGFKQLARQISVLAFICTLLGACFYGFLFYGASLLLGLNLSLPVCLMFGSIVAPTDPIAATSILSKFGLPKNISFLIEGESLFNDGVGLFLGNGDRKLLGRLFQRHDQRDLRCGCGRRNRHITLLPAFQKYQEQNARYFCHADDRFGFLRHLRMAQLLRCDCVRHLRNPLSVRFCRKFHLGFFLVCCTAWVRDWIPCYVYFCPQISKSAISTRAGISPSITHSAQKGAPYGKH